MQFIDFPSSSNGRSSKKSAINFHLFCRQRGQRSKMLMLAGGRGSGDGSNDIGCLDAVVNTLLIAKHLARCPGSKVTRHGISSGFWLKSGCLFVLSLSLSHLLHSPPFVAHQLLFAHPLFAQKLGRLPSGCRLLCALAPDDDDDGHG